MEKYIGTKIIEAEPQSQSESAGHKDLIAKSGGVDQPGYKVVYEDGYTSWSPKEVFEKAYRQTNGMKMELWLQAGLLHKPICWQTTGVLLSKKFNGWFRLFRGGVVTSPLFL